MATLGLQFQEKLGYIFGVDFLPQVFLADLMVLAIYAVQSAPAEKNGSGAEPPGQRRLFPEVRQHPRHTGSISLAAKARLPVCPDSVTLPGTQSAGRKAVNDPFEGP